LSAFLTPLLNRRTVVFAMSGVVALGGVPRAAAASDQLRILVIGDSQAQGLAAGLERMLRSDRHYRVLDRSKISTGLISSRYDWPAAAQRLAQTEHANLVVVMFGANDRPPIRITGSIDPGMKISFSERYGAKVRQVVTPFAEQGIPVIWVGHPVVRNPRFSEDVAIDNGIYAAEARRAGADYVSSWHLLAGPDGSYAAFGKGVDGETTRLRADDGVHMTPAGYNLLANYLLPRIAADLHQTCGPGAGRPCPAEDN
jgi:hypothetical protein